MCQVCSLKLTPEVYNLFDKACVSCQRHIKQMMAGFNGINVKHRKQKNTWDNSEAYEDWKSKLGPTDFTRAQLDKKDEYVHQRCDIRDMKRICGLPKFIDLEHQVFTAWVLDGENNERIQEVLGLTYSQLQHVKTVVKIRLQKQMAYYRTIQKLEQENRVK